MKTGRLRDNPTRLTEASAKCIAARNAAFTKIQSLADGRIVVLPIKEWTNLCDSLRSLEAAAKKQKG